LFFAILKEKDMKKLTLSIVLFVLFAAVASAAVPGEDREYQAGVKDYNTRNYKTAVKHLEEYVGNNPDPTAYFLIGYSMYKLGKFSEADEYFSEAYLIDPEFSPEKGSLAKKPSEEILPNVPAAAKETVAASGTKISQPAAETEEPQRSKLVYEAFAEQKARGAEPTQEPATTLSPGLSAQKFVLVPQFIESATPSEAKKSTAVEESALEQETEYKEAEENGISDPLEPWNRAMFTFNDKFYFWVAKPLARGYSAIVPEWGRVRVKNIFQNITMPVRFVNNLLQLKIRGAGTELLRFVFNTTAGVGGMFDVAKNIDLKVPEEDLGQTLGVYGIGNGFYIIWPVLGLSSLRDSVGTVGDFFLDPVSYITPTESQIGVRTFDYTNETSLHIGDYEDMKESAVDPYISFRSAYIEYRKNKIKE
jgi:phospholipid-binding lipoprotein MlaA